VRTAGTGRDRVYRAFAISLRRSIEQADRESAPWRNLVLTHSATYGPNKSTKRFGRRQPTFIGELQASLAIFCRPVSLLLRES